MELWYAVLRDREDNDWGYGSYDRQEAEKMALEMGPEAYIAVINNEGDPVCVEEISQEDFGMKTMYAIMNKCKAMSTDSWNSDNQMSSYNLQSEENSSIVLRTRQMNACSVTLIG